MFIKSIHLENFQCYSGNDNSFEFKEGLNIIIGDNGAGKSKLYDAFNWVLYDKVFNSASRDFEYTSIVKNQLISDKTKFLCEIGEYAKVSVTLVVKNSRNVEYILTRSYQSQKMSEFNWKDDAKSELSIFKKEILVPKLISNKEEQERVLRNIIPDGIKPYMWFQGEEVDKLIDFKKSDSLTHAINALSDIKEFDAYKDIAEIAFKAAEDEFKREQKRVSSHSQKYEELEKSRLQYNEELRRALKELEILNETMVRAEEEKQKIISKIEDASKISQLQEQIKSAEQTVQRLTKELDKRRVSFSKNLFTQKWLLLGLDWTSRFGEKYSNYEKQKIEREIALQAQLNTEREFQGKFNLRLPPDVPEPIYVKQMLDSERCFVCNRDAPKNSEPWNKINELLKLQKPSTSAQTSLVNKKSENNFDVDFKKLYHNGLGLQKTIENIEANIGNHYSSIKEIEEEHTLSLRQLENLQQDIRSIIERTNIDELGSVYIVSQFDSYDKQIQQHVREKQYIEARINRAKSRISEIEKEIATLTTGKMPQTLIDKKNLLQDFYAIAINTRERVFNRLISQLEAEANEHFIKMSAENKAVRGSIKLVKQPNGTYMPRNLDENGIELSSINDSNIILIKLAVIMAIISAKKAYTNTDLYTLITDAPTSKFSENYVIGFCKTVATVYKQSIIMSKDFYYNTDLRQRLIKELGDELGSMYIIEPSVSENERTNRNTLSIFISQEKY